MARCPLCGLGKLGHPQRWLMIAQIGQGSTGGCNPIADGRAGMAALTLDDGVEALDIDGFSRYIADSLPAYARPVFLRIQPDIDVTGTFKMVKGDLRKQGYDLTRVQDPLYVLKPKESVYAVLDEAYAARIAAGEAGF